MDSEWVIGAPDVGVRLDRFLAEAGRLGSRSRAASALERGQVLINGAGSCARDGSRRLAEGDVVRLWLDRPGSARSRLGTIDDVLRIVFEDEALLVVDKPAGVLAVPLDHHRGPASAYERIEDRLRSHGKRRPFTVHRIDRDTSGLVVFAKHAAARAALQAQFRRREPERVYLAVVHGRPEPPAGTWRDHLTWDEGAGLQKPARRGGARATEAISDYRVTETFRDAALVEVRLVTGKQHQIRAQACLHGHTLVGEPRYIGEEARRQPIAHPRQALHAHRLAVRHPQDGRALRFEAPLPADLRELIARLRRDRRPPP